jgi:glyoxylase I family protein
MFTAIDHPAIACYDTKKQIEWYCSVLGMRVLASNENDPPTALVGYGNGTAIELMPARVQEPRPEEQNRWQPGLRHLALRVEDFDKAYARLQAAGARFIGEPATAIGGGKIISFRDPEGNELQIVQR